MKAYLKALILVVTALSAFCCNPSDRIGNKLEELDRFIYDQHYLEECFQKENESIMRAAAEAGDDSLKWEAEYSLFYRYSHWNTDSAVVHLNNMAALVSENPGLEAQNKVCRALSFAISGNKEKAQAQIFNISPEEVNSTFVSRYFLLGNEILESQDDDQARIDILYEALQWEDKFSYSELQFINAEIESCGNNDDSAMSYYKDAFETEESGYIKSTCAFRMAGIYGSWGDYDLMKYWMAEAAIQGAKAQSRDTKPLYNLVLILFKDKDLSRASNYIHQIIENSLCIGQNTQLILSSLETQQAISEALDYNKSTRLKILGGAASILGIMLIIILVLLANANRDRKHIRQSRLILAEANERLRDSDLIKENFMFRYMQMSIKYLSSVEEYRHHLRKTLREEGSEALKTMLRKPLGSGEDYDEFYRIFDENFLKLYPDFVRNVNTLLPEEDRFDSELKNLSTQLRILATIRLGLTDSGQIAKFLNCASSSVYSYRSRLKHKALCGSEQFEKLIKTLN